MKDHQDPRRGRHHHHGPDKLFDLSLLNEVYAENPDLKGPPVSLLSLAMTVNRAGLPVPSSVPVPRFAETGLSLPARCDQGVQGCPPARHRPSTV